ncbi:MAG: NAD(P)-dependent oxidoreductase, partial [Candidatus Latescibacteria bacterium]|nr:NAD(P)-dependent oxidoreductase [Candidatus Latescibacterota bacterium]
VLSIHVPLAPETRGLVDSLIFEALPPGAVLINTSRGAIVDETAMLSALEFGRLAGAATDVISDETGPDTQISHALFDYANRKSNLLITPHVAGATFESMHSTEEFVAQKCVEFVSARMSG